MDNVDWNNNSYQDALHKFTLPDDRRAGNLDHDIVTYESDMKDLC